ncbi:hypothetical protein [Burkholderia ubonensis]|uniref:hypothetical protein n=1 Tax=Burkholderia ubonensis TaxID=101571 RepID=UPI000B1BFCCD|nr:hypothetical protein [Burkholderia ubonensis]
MELINSVRLKGIPETDEHFAKLLFADKHTTIEGSAAEAFTEKRLVRPAFGNALSSVGWWFHRSNDDGYGVSAVSCIDPVRLRTDEPIERTLAKRLRMIVPDFHWIFFDGASYVSRSVEIDSISRRFDRLQCKLMENTAGPKERDPLRLQKAVDRLRYEGVLRDFAIQRLYANFFSRIKWIWDIDGLLLYKDVLVAFDYKFKYPARNGEVGANEGMADVYQFLEKCGALVVYLLLKKADDKNVSPITLLDSNDQEWLACDASSFHENSKRLENVEGTGYRGEKPNRSRSIPLERFVSIKKPEELRAFVDKCLEAKGLNTLGAH